MEAPPILRSPTPGCPGRDRCSGNLYVVATLLRSVPAGGVGGRKDAKRASCWSWQYALLTNRDRFSSNHPQRYNLQLPPAIRESPMPLHARESVLATHDIQRGHHTVVKRRTQGKVIGSWPNWSSTTYSVEFRSVRGATITMSGLTERDVQSEPGHDGQDDPPPGFPTRMEPDVRSPKVAISMQETVTRAATDPPVVQRDRPNDANPKSHPNDRR